MTKHFVVAAQWTLAVALLGCGSAGGVESVGSIQQGLTSSVDLKPSSATASGISGSGCSSPYWTCVDDGTSFASSDDATTVARTSGSAGTHTLGYSGGPAGTGTQVVVHYRASTTASSTAGTVQIKIYDGTTLLRTGSSHTVGSTFANFDDTFSGLSIANINNLKTAVTLTRTSGSGSVRHTILWVTATLDTGGPADAGSPTLAVQFANTVISRWPDPRNITGTTRGWDYNNGIVLRGMMEVFNKTRDPRYLAYIKQYVDAFVDASGNLYVDSARTKRIQDQTYSLDLIQPANLLLFLQREVPGDTRYPTAATIVRNMFATFPTNANGGFWHKQAYPNEMWLDGIYMAEPFLVRYGSVNASCGAYCNDTPVAQATLLANHARIASGLLLHGWDADHNAAWCTGTCAGTTGTGLSPEVWGRGLGWYAMALVDVLEFLPASHPGRSSLLTLLSGIAAGAQTAQDASTGLFCQVLDKCSQSGNWTESSASGMLVYALKTAVARGYISSSYGTVAQRAWNGLKTLKVSSDSSGPTILDTSDGTGVQSSFAAYVAIARKTNFYHGLCAIQLAAAAMEY